MIELKVAYAFKFIHGSRFRSLSPWDHNPNSTPHFVLENILLKSFSIWIYFTVQDFKLHSFLYFFIYFFYLLLREIFTHQLEFLKRKEKNIWYLVTFYYIYRPIKMYKKVFKVFIDEHESMKHETLRSKVCR